MPRGRPARRLADLVRQTARCAASTQYDDVLTSHYSAYPHVRAQLKGGRQHHHPSSLPATTVQGGAAPRQTGNRVLAERHRVAITQFTLLSQNGMKAGVAPFASLDELCAWVVAAGYDALELGVDDIRRSFMPQSSYDDIVRHIRSATTTHGIPFIGVLYHITDHPGGFASTVKAGKGGTNPNIGPQDLDLNDIDFWARLRQRLALDRSIGAQYITFQINLPPQYLSTGGMYREDKGYLQRVANDIAKLQTACFEQGLNMYVETHMDRLSEDLGAFCEIMDCCPVYFEVNADISHYAYRAITTGSWLAKILSRVGHTHTRMARAMGDLSAEVADPAADWDAEGLTWQAWQSMLPALAGGLSSRTIVGESGPIHLVRSALETDRRLLPLWRMMAEYADREAGIAPVSFNPFAAAPAPTVWGLLVDALPSSGRLGATGAERVLAEYYAATPHVAQQLKAGDSGSSGATAQVATDPDRVLAEYYAATPHVAQQLKRGNSTATTISTNPFRR